jgi:hypothetical protein
MMVLDGEEMSTINEVRSAEKRVRELLDVMKRDPMSANGYADELRNATDDYTRAVRELKVRAK